MPNPLEYQLPEGYHLVDQIGKGWRQIGISPEEVMHLRKMSGSGSDERTDLWEKVLSESIATTGVASSSGNLVGIGFLAGNARHAVLCDLDVHPSHRHQGIARTIIQRRLQVADFLEIPHLYTELGENNTLRDFYIELGFKATGQVLTRKI